MRRGINREIIDESGRVLNEDQVFARDNKSLEDRKEFSAKMLPEWGAAQSPELAETLKKIDFNLLRKIFEELATRCGLDPQAINFLSAERVVSVFQSTAPAYYDEEKNLIFVTDHIFRPVDEGRDSESLKRIKRQPDVFGGKLLALLFMIIHEEIHSISYQKHKKNKKGEIDLTYESKMGYHSQKESQTGGIKNLFHALNEGVTQKLTIELALKYTELSMLNEGREKFKKQLTENRGNIGYGREMDMVDAIGKKIAENTGQHERVIWQALVRGMLEGLNFNRPSVKNLFTEIFGKKFLTKLKTTGRVAIDGEQSISNIINQAESEDIFKILRPQLYEPSTIEKIAEFFENLIVKEK